MNKLKGKTALVTGGTSGIGLATAALFQREGANLIVTGRDASGLAHAQEVLGDQALVIRSDAGKLADIEVLMQLIVDRFGRLDVIFANAGFANPAPIERVTEEQFDEIVAVNFKGVFFTIQKALPILSENASIIATTSIANRKGVPNFGVYGASKAALRSLVQTMAVTLASRGVRINAISPGPIDTAAFDRFGLPKDMVEARKREMEQKSPIKRFGTADEVAKAALFLACDDSSYLVGEEIVVDGGISLV